MQFANPLQLPALLASAGLTLGGAYAFATDAWGLQTAIIGGPTSFRRFAARLAPEGVHPDVAMWTLLGTVALVVVILGMILTSGPPKR